MEQETPAKVKTPPKSEFAYLAEYGNRNLYKMPTSFEKCNLKRGEQFHFRVTQIYDPSKFWIVIKFRELEVFQKSLFRSYYLNRNKYKVPVGQLEVEMYCVCFTEGGYHRGVIVSLPCEPTHHDQQVQVFFIDYGMVDRIDAKNVYYMSRKVMDVPQFSVRASLSGICPKKEGTWTTEDVAEFHKLVNDKILQGLVVNLDADRKVVEIICCEKVDGLLTVPVHKKLIAEKRARYFQEPHEPSDNKSEFVFKHEYPYLFPSHEALESGKVPQDVSGADYQLALSNVMCSTLMNRYFDYKQENK